MTKYRSVAPLGTAVIAAVSGVLALAVAEAVIITAWNLDDGSHWSQFERAANLQHLLVLAVGLVAFVLTADFIHSATRNLHDLGPARPRFAGGAALWWLFVPIGNIFMAHQILTALWRESQPTPPMRLAGGFDRSVALVNAWWLLLMATAVASYVGPHFAHGGGPLAKIASELATVALRIAAGGAFIAIVRGIVRRQREQWIDVERRQRVPQPSAAALR